MILRKIKLENFGLYAGICEIDLAPRKSGSESRPIILIGGKNGAGKTTLLEAVRLSLYGRRAMGTRVGQSEYDDYLKRRVHQTAPTQAASVGLEFDYAEAGVVHRYLVRRDWVVRGKTVVETLSLEKDGAPVTSVPRDEWQQFLQELIPPGVSQLFFFDGEKIREIADAENNNEQLAQAIRGLLGIDLIERARTDLGLYLAREQQNETADGASRLEAVLRDIEQKDERIREISELICDLDTKRETQARAAEAIKRRFVAEGGEAAAHRTKLEVERDELRRRIAACNNLLRELSNGLLPFALAPNLLQRFGTVLHSAATHGNGPSSAESLLAAVDEWRKSGSPKRQAEWEAKHWSDVKRFIKARVDSERQLEPHRALADLDIRGTMTKLGEIELAVRPRVHALSNEMEEVSTRLAEIEASLARAENADSSILLDELRLADKELGATEAVLAASEEELATINNQKAALEREQRKLLEDQANAAISVHRVELAGRVAQSLATFERRLLDRKLAQLRIEFVRHFNFLARKTDLVADIQIDPDTFAATLVDGAGRAIPKVSLSAGEQQVYAIAMLWALAKTSGRPLPMIIDTPLARLDSEHRDNLLERYFPHASHQVVLLSTDTEITNSLLSHLEQRVSHSFRLDYDPARNCTTVSSGYFEDLNHDAVRDRRRAI